jgi:hypothetical protein
VPDEHLISVFNLIGDAILNLGADVVVAEVAGDLLKRPVHKPSGEGHPEGGEPSKSGEPIDGAALCLTHGSLLVVAAGIQVGQSVGGGTLVGVVVGDLWVPAGPDAVGQGG